MNKEALASLRSQGEQVGQAMLRQEHDKMLATTLPVVIEKLGGSKKFLATMATMAQTMKAQGVEFIGVQVQDPSSTVDTGKDLYGVVPYSLEMKIKGKNLVTPSYLLGLSEDRGKTWHFVDGAELRDNRSKVKTVLPRLPDGVVLPRLQ